MSEIKIIQIDGDPETIVIQDIGTQGVPGEGVAPGGTANQALTKIDGTNYNTQWSTIDKAFVGLGNVDNTSDLNKPISTATQTALNAKQDLIGYTPENVANKDNGALSTSSTTYPTSGSVKTYVDNAVSAVSVPDATSLVKGKIRLAGDLSGTADAPTVPALGDKEDDANKSNDTNLGTSTVFYPTQNAVKVYVDNAVSGVSTPDATALVKGKLRLTGDLGGTADSPTVPGLASKANSATTISTSAPLSGGGDLSANRTLSISQATTSADGYLSSTDWNTFNSKQSALGFTPENVSNKSTNTALGTSDTLYPTQNAVKTYVDGAVSGGVPDATSTVKGKLRLSGDLSGTADTPTVPALANKEDVANKSNNTALGTSATLYPTQNAVKTYVDAQVATGLPIATFNAYNDLQKEPTGFENNISTAISFDNATRTFDITPTSGSYDFYVKGTKFTKSAPISLVIPNVTGSHYIYFDNTGTLVSTLVFDPTIITDNAFVSIVYWNTATSVRTYFANERHGLVMDGATHSYLHTVLGARYLSGGALQGFSVNGTGNNATDAQFTSDSGSIRDEDLLIQYVAQSQIPILYRIGSDWRKKTADSFPVIYSGTAGYTGASGRLPYNQLTGGSWTLTEVPNNNFVLVHIFATNDIDNPVVGIQGINSYGSISSARTGAVSEITTLAGLPFAEFVALGSVIFETANTYANTPKARIRSTDTGADYVDFRGTQTFTPSSAVASSHSLLSNLSNDDHLQYLTDARGDVRYYTKAQVDSSLSGKANTTTTISTSAPLSGGGDLSANRTLAIAQATAISDGYLSAIDWATFNGKQNALGFTPENVANKDNGTLTTSTTTYPTSGAVKTAVDAKANLAGGNSFTGSQTFGDGVIDRFSGNIVTVVSFPYTLQASDNGKVLRFNAGSNSQVDLPNNLPVGFNIAWSQAGSGVITFAPASGATMNNRQGHTKTAGQHAMGTLMVMTNSGGASAMYNLAGDTGA